MNRIYLNHVFEIINSDTKIRAYLSYLKLRSQSRFRCGGFSFQDLKQVLQVSDTTARKHLKNLLQHQYAIQTKENLYHVVSHLKISKELYCKEKFIKLSDEKLFSYSWKNIQEFKAELVELRIQVNRNYRHYLAIDKTRVDRHGVRETIKGRGISPLDTLVASAYVSEMTGLSSKTILRYRRTQKSVEYSKKKILRFRKLDVSDSGDILEKEKFGKFFISGNDILFVPISTREGQIKIHLAKNSNRIKKSNKFG